MLPNLLVIGAQKCGTTSLHAYLEAHPDISMSDPKELDFFVSPEDSATGAGNWLRGREWYSSHFTQPTAVRGEASPNYTVHPLVGAVAGRAASVVPEARLIYLVRDPIDRIVSHYLHRRAAGRERRSLDEALSGLEAGPARGFVYRSMYFMQLEQWLEHYPRSALLVVAQEDLRAERTRTLDRVFRFLGVDESFISDEFATMRHVSTEAREPGRAETRLRRTGIAAPLRRVPARLRVPAYAAFRSVAGRKLERPVLPPERREELRSMLEEDVRQLRALTGQAFSSWSL